MALDAGNKIVNTNSGTVVDGKDVGGGFFVTETLASIPSYANVQGALCYNKDDGKFYQRGVSNWEEADLGGGGTEDYASVSNFPATGEAGVIYLAKDTNNIYRYDVSNSEYVEISPFVAEADVEVIEYQTLTALTDAQWEKAKKGKLIIRFNVSNYFSLFYSYTENSVTYLNFRSQLTWSAQTPSGKPTKYTFKGLYFEIPSSTKIMGIQFPWINVEPLMYKSQEFLGETDNPATYESKWVLGKNLARTQGMIYATEYSASTVYKIGDLVTRENNLYECNTDMSASESWTSAHWTQTTLGDYVKKWGYGIITIKISASGTLDSALLAQVLANPYKYRFYDDYDGYYFDNYDPGSINGALLTYVSSLIVPNSTSVFQLEISKQTGDYAIGVFELIRTNPTVPSGTTPTQLNNLRVGNYYYSIPYTAIEGNPTVPSGTTPTSLTGLKINNSYYTIPSGSGSSESSLVFTVYDTEFEDLNNGDPYPGGSSADVILNYVFPFSTAGVQASASGLTLPANFTPSRMGFVHISTRGNNSLNLPQFIQFDAAAEDGYLIFVKTQFEGFVQWYEMRDNSGKGRMVMFLPLVPLIVNQFLNQFGITVPSGFSTDGSDAVMVLFDEKEEFEPMVIHVGGEILKDNPANPTALNMNYLIEKEEYLQVLLDAATRALSTTVTKDNFNTVVQGIWQQTSSDPTMRYRMLYMLMHGLKSLGVEPRVFLQETEELPDETTNYIQYELASFVSTCGDTYGNNAYARILFFTNGATPINLNPLDPAELKYDFDIRLSTFSLD